MNKYVKRAALGLVTASSLGIAGFLYIKTQPASAALNTTLVNRFGKLHTLDAEIAQQTLASRHGLLPNYDPLTRTSRGFLNEMALLRRDLTPLVQDSSELGSLLSELEKTATTRNTAVEQFKTQNAVLKNSLYYLPLAGQQVNASLGAESASSSQAVSDLVQRVLTQNLVGGRAEANKVEEQLQLVEGLAASVPEAERDRLRLFVMHAQTASRLQQQVDPIVRKDVLDAPVAAALTRLERAYGQSFQASLNQANLYRNILYGWSTLLLLAVLVAATKLRSLYSNLERLVRERTNSLNDALKELWGEMELAKKIQTALVPQRFELKNCDVAAIMRPTDQVGGDYYDAFKVGGVEWVLIGDVSGHGVPAGLVMMMCQTSVRSVLAANPNIGPDELLSTVNRTLTENIERLGEDKYMTISALKREADGSFSFAGMHQDILVYRAGTGRVETFLAQGTWLGIQSDIRELNPVRNIRLNPGDVLTLYTDGITEARRDDEMLDIDGLKATLLEHGAKSADEILGGIMQRLETYEVCDDVAAVIIKQLEPAHTLRENAA